MFDLPHTALIPLLKALIDTLPIGVAVLDPQLRLRLINQRQASLNQLPIEQQIGKTVREFIPAAAEVIEAKLGFVLEHKRPLIKQQIRGKKTQDGKQLYRLASYYPILDEHEQIILILALIQDDRLDDVQFQVHQESQNRLLSVLDNLFTFVGVLDLDGTLINVNRAPLDAGGISADDVLGKKFWDCYWWSYEAQIQEKIRHTIKRSVLGEVCRFDIPVRMKFGEIMWIDFMLAPLRDEDGVITHLIPSGIDISQRHQSEVALHRSEDWLKSVIASSEEAIITKDLQGKVTSWNPAAQRLLGYSAEEMIGQPILRIFPADRIRDEAAILERISAGELIPAFETERMHKLGHLIPISVSISPLRDKFGNVVGACKIAHDISKEKQYTQMLEQALNEKTSLLHEVHHRVKNNLQIVSSLLNLQSRRVSAEVAEALAVSQGRIKAMALIHQLLYESHNMSEVPLAEFLRKLLALSAPIYAADKKGIQLRLSPDLDESLRLDVQRMIPCGLIINELILNAVKHAFHGQEQGQVYISLEHQGPDLIIVVKDNGCGLPDNFSWRKQTGLGSQLIPMFAQQLKARLNFSSTTEGTRFELSFSYLEKELSNEC